MSSKINIDPRVWTVERFVKQVLFIAQDGGAGANFLQLMLGKHRGFFQQYQRHIISNNEFISSMPLYDAEHKMQRTTFLYSDGEISQAEGYAQITKHCLDTLRNDEGSMFNQWDRITAQTHCPNYHLQHLLDPQHQLLTILPKRNKDHAFYRTLDVIKQWDHPFEKTEEWIFALRDIDMDNEATRKQCEELYSNNRLSTLGMLWIELDVYKDKMHYLETAFSNAQEPMHKPIDNSVCDHHAILYEDFFMQRSKESYFDLCKWLQIHPEPAIHSSMIDNYHDANMELVEKNQDIYYWFFDKMEKS